MTTAEGRDLAIIAVIAVAPLAIVLLVALIRGYTITVHLTREGRHRKDSTG